MEDYEKAEKMLAKITGGKTTPGSGNKRQKGDVVVHHKNYYLEAKQTSQPYMTIQAEWLSKLVREAKGRECILVIFFGLRGYPFYHDAYTKVEAKPWKSLRVYENELPELLTHETGNWELDTYESLRDL